MMIEMMTFMGQKKKRWKCNDILRKHEVYKYNLINHQLLRRYSCLWWKSFHWNGMCLSVNDVFVERYEAVVGEEEVEVFQRLR